MSKNIKVGAHSCVIDPREKDAGPQVGDEYGRTFPWLSPWEADETVTLDSVIFATETST